jgi:hypothetical protein
MLDAESLCELFRSWEQLVGIPLAIGSKQVWRRFGGQPELFEAVVQVGKHGGKELKSKLTVGQKVANSRSPGQDVAAAAAGWITPCHLMPSRVVLVSAGTSLESAKAFQDRWRESLGRPHDSPCRMVRSHRSSRRKGELTAPGRVRRLELGK